MVQFFETIFRSTILDSSNLSKVIIDKKPDTKGIELLGKDDGTGFNKESDELKSNKALINYILSKMDDKFKEIIVNDNPGLT